MERNALMNQMFPVEQSEIVRAHSMPGSMALKWFRESIIFGNRQPDKLRSGIGLEAGMQAIELRRNRGKTLLCIGTLLFAAAGCSQQPNRRDAGNSVQVTVEDPDSDEDMPSATGSRSEDSKPTLPPQELTEAILYEFLLAEIAGQRGNVGLSAQAYHRDSCICANEQHCPGVGANLV
jgi:hypothetical protein